MFGGPASRSRHSRSNARYLSSERRVITATTSGRLPRLEGSSEGQSDESLKKLKNKWRTRTLLNNVQTLPIWFGNSAIGRRKTQRTSESMAMAPSSEENGPTCTGGGEVAEVCGGKGRRGGSAGEEKRRERAARKLAQASEADDRNDVSLGL